MQQTTEPLAQPTIPLGWIRPGKNPRTYFDPAAMEELIASVKSHGVIEPIVVRPLSDGAFEIVAGERRYRAAKAALGDDYEMPVTVKALDDEQAGTIALIENIQREGMSPAEEARAAADEVGKRKGDRDEAARVLGWSRATLEKRLALMNCSTMVLNALNVREIQLGHAELLATLAKDKQDVFLPIIVKEKKTVAELKQSIEQAACNLKDAVFDKAACTTCPHNSELQSEMFSETISTGCCTNPSCYKEKTEQALEAVKYRLKEEYPTIRIIRVGDNHTRVQLQVDGPTGVGAEQAKACHACQYFGAAVSALPDSMGRVFRGQCFDTACNTKKVAARIKSERAASAPPVKTGQQSSTQANGVGGKGAKELAAVTAISESDKVRTYRHALWRKALRREVAANEATANHYLLSVAMTDQARTITADTMGKLYEKIVGEQCSRSDLAKNLSSVAALEADRRSRLTIAAAVAAIDGIDVPNLVILCKYHKLDLRGHWNLQKSKDFLELLTKSELKVLVDEMSMRPVLGDRFTKMFNKPKPELIDDLLKVEGFNYAGKVPKVLCF
ncbi:PRTRC system ParB family protein [Ralstonia nicotianae]|uniref:PRTRC system ParB family protein n=1 Tax=Ralstonia pseudosolanacearum TaxID=1310165 RepID=UPI002004657C|nr:PRTRC system ParB family protein [Ralstonia pseudosolanacearum]MCK4118364.1 PRTRC system ParB family protein [Ralstonia pseudosolanacearum]